MLLLSAPRSIIVSQQIHPTQQQTQPQEIHTNNNITNGNSFINHFVHIL